MAYTPINWQNGDTITAAKMNKMDNGWSVETTQYFSETLTTASGNYGYQATMAYAGDPTTISIMTIVFDGTAYTCERQSSGGDYWWGAPSPSDFSEYPFDVLWKGGTWYLITETAGTHTVTGSAKSVETSENFRSAVNSFVDTSMMPMLCVSGTTTYDEMAEAYDSGRILYFRAGETAGFIGKLTSTTIVFVPESEYSALFVDGVFFVTNA